MAAQRPADAPTLNTHMFDGVSTSQDQARLQNNDALSEKTDGKSDGETPVNENPTVLRNKEYGDKIEITEEDCYDELGYSYPEWKKWSILTVIFLVQVSLTPKLYWSLTHDSSFHT
jgi:hypothetical protein